MLVRQMEHMDYQFNGRTLGELMAIPPLYPNAFPWKRSIYGSVAPVTLQAKSTGVTALRDAWPLNQYRTMPTAGFTLAVSSTSASDTALGTGAQAVEVDVIEFGTFAAKSILIPLNGQTKVVDTSGTVCWRINDIRVAALGSGSSNANVGTIYAFNNSSAVTGGVPNSTTAIYSVIAAGENLAKQMFYTVPRGYMMLIINARGGISDIQNTSRSATLFFSRSAGINPLNSLPIWYSLEIGGSMTVGQGLDVHPEWKLTVEQERDLRYLVQASGAADIVTYADAILVPWIEGFPA